MNRIVTIGKLGRQGDGEVDADGVTLHVPFTLPGESVEIAENGGKPTLLRVIESSPARREPICPHFGQCGGCQLQHFAAGQYGVWKQGLLSSALLREGIEHQPDAMLGFGDRARRRIVLTAARTGDRVVLGFSERSSNRIVDIRVCPVLVPAIENGLPALREIASALCPKKGTIKLAVVACENGLDVAVNTGIYASEKSRNAAMAIAGRQGFTRFTINGELACAVERPLLAVGKTMVTPPPEGFVQAVAAAEHAMAELVIGHMREAKRACDLFSGYGAFALRMAEHATVLAVEANAEAIDALTRAWKESGGILKAIGTQRRDLFRSPVNAEELKGMGAVVFDPPRAGAEAQALQLAASRVPLIAAISCNPVTLARDLRILLDGGYRIDRIVPIDQFLYTPHLEAVALLRR